MRIALLTTSYPASAGDAAGHFVQTQARALAAEGHRVTVFAPGPARVALGNPREIWLPDGDACGAPGLLPRLRQRPTRVVGLLRFGLAARAALQERAPFDRVIAHWLVPSAFPVAWSTAVASELEVVVHGSDARLLSRWPARAARAVLSALLRRGAHFRCVSDELASLLVGLGPPGLAERIHVAPLPLDCSGAPSRDSARQQLDIAPETRLVLVMARLISSKRVDVALGAAQLIEGLTVVVLGDGPERARLAQRYPDVLFLGQLPRDLALTWLAAADALLSASREEGSPSVVREARALGIPVAALSSGDLTRWAARDAGLWVVP